MSKKERNQIFNYLYVLAIIMVIDDHTSTRIGILSSIFPYNSFYMPLFVFISGYFYKRANVNENIVYKVKRLLIPYTVWNVAALLVGFIIDKTCGVDWVKMPTLNRIVRSFFIEPMTSVNGAAWFVIMLFWVSIVYNMIRNVIKPSVIGDILLTVLHLLGGCVSVYLCTKGYSARSDCWVFALRLVFYIQFFHYGYIFKQYLESRLKRLNKLAVCCVCVAINVILILIYGDSINFYATCYMASFSYWYLPIITSITGIVFWYEVMELFSRKIGQNSVIDFIARNTFVIMQSHLLFVNIPNFYVYYQILNGNNKYLDFDMGGFCYGTWVRYSYNTRLAGFFCGIIGSLIVAWVLEKIKQAKNESWQSNKENILKNSRCK